HGQRLNVGQLDLIAFLQLGDELLRFRIDHVDRARQARRSDESHRVRLGIDGFDRYGRLDLVAYRCAGFTGAFRHACGAGRRGEDADGLALALLLEFGGQAFVVRHDDFVADLDLVEITHFGRDLDRLDFFVLAQLDGARLRVDLVHGR